MTGDGELPGSGRGAVVRRALAAASLMFLGCGPGPPPVAVPSGAKPIELRLDHLRHLGIDVTVAGRPGRAVALYAEAPDYHPIGSPARDGFEGIAAVDDAARAAVVYLRHFEQTADPRSTQEALGLLTLVPAMALLVMLANWPGIAAELRNVRVIAPRRVTEDDIEMAPAAEPQKMSPWD